MVVWSLLLQSGSWARSSCVAPGRKDGHHDASKRHERSDRHHGRRRNEAAQEQASIRHSSTSDARQTPLDDGGYQTGLPVFLCAFGCRQAADEFLYTANRADPVQTLRVSPVAFVDGEMNFVPKEAA